MRQRVPVKTVLSGFSSSGNTSDNPNLHPIGDCQIPVLFQYDNRVMNSETEEWAKRVVATTVEARLLMVISWCDDLYLPVITDT